MKIENDVKTIQEEILEQLVRIADSLEHLAKCTSSSGEEAWYLDVRNEVI